jgi:hypothetical protein
VHTAQVLPAAAGRNPRGSRGRFIAVLALAIAALVAATASLGPLQGALQLQGLEATYYGGPDFLDPPIATRIDRRIDLSTVLERVSDRETFSVEWLGLLVIDRTGEHLFRVRSDDGAWLEIDGRLVVDNGGVHGSQVAEGRIDLTRGLHPLRIRYFQAGGGRDLAVEWASPGNRLEPLPADAIMPRSSPIGSAVLRRLLLSLPLVVYVAWAVLVAGVAVVWPVAAAIRAIGRRNGVDWSAGSFRLTLLLSFALSVWGIDWGLPGWFGWAPDELTPADIFDGMSWRFTGGWHNPYPPLQFYLLSISYLPFIAADRVGILEAGALDTVTAMYLLARLVTVVMSAGTLCGLWAAASEVLDRRGASFALLIVALTMPFVYYAKTANVDVPYLFWFAWSLYFFIRCVRHDELADYLLLAVTAVGAVTTKDQAYGLYALTPLALLASRARRHNGRVLDRAGAAVFDRRIWLAGLTAGVLFALVHNVPLNWHGAVAHFRLIARMGGGAGMFPPTPGGQASLLATSVDLVRWSLGWPMFLLCVGGVALALADRRRRVLFWLMAPVASYYITFIGVVLYTYDRFMLPASFVLAFFGGAMAAGLTDPARRWPRARRALACGIFAYSLLYAASIDVTLNLDARYAAERWMAAHIGPDDLVGAVGVRAYLPRVHAYRWRDLPADEEALRAIAPRFVVLNARYAERLATREPHRRFVEGLRSGDLGYTLVLRQQPSRLPAWALLQYDPMIANGREDGVTNLDKLNPEILIYRRAGE